MIKLMESIPNIIKIIVCAIAIAAVVLLVFYFGVYHETPVSIPDGDEWCPITCP